MFFIPKKIKVGYQERHDTYSKKLAYVIYYDDKGVLRKETSWQGWRDDKIDPDDLDNVPTSGFVLNKTAGGKGYSSWDTRKTYCRVYDPRGFEFEIDISNLLYILENTNSIVGKGLEGEFVYGWDGTELVLLPVSAPDYAENKKKSDMMFNSEFVKAKDMVPGVIYTKKNGERLMFLGKDREFNKDYDIRWDVEGGETEYGYIKSDKKVFWFYDVDREFDNEYPYWSFKTFASRPQMYVPENNEPDSRYAEILSHRDNIGEYNPILKIEYKEVSPFDLAQSKKRDDYAYNLDGCSVDIRWSKLKEFVVSEGKNEFETRYAMPVSDSYRTVEPKFYNALEFIRKYDIKKVFKKVRYDEKNQ